MTNELDILLWGDNSSGKTVYLSQLYLNLGESFNTEKLSLDSVASSETARTYFDARRQEMLDANELPSRTNTDDEFELVFELKSSELKNDWLLNIVDRSGEVLVKPSDKISDSFESADGLLIFLSSIDQRRLFSTVKRTISDIRFSLPKVKLSETPVAVCLTKFDAHINSLAEFEYAQSNREEIARSVIDDMQTFRYLEESFKQVSYFPISSLGMKIHGKTADKIIFLDNELNNRIVITDQVRKLNLLEPLEWLATCRESSL